VADLKAAGADATIGGNFLGDPISTQAVNVCVGSEEVKVYVFGTEAERTAVSSTIDPNDAGSVGNSLVDWAGVPKFWARDRIVVLYLGTDAATTTLLMSVLGNTISHGQGRQQLLPGSCPG
jgi:hypothetical protein